MNLPVLNPYLAGTEVTADMLNEVNQAIEFLLDPPECHVVATSAQTIANNTSTMVTLHQVIKDNERDKGFTPMWAVGNPTRITVRTAGWYEIEYTCPMAASTDSKKVEMALRFNAGGTLYGRQDQMNSVSGTNSTRTPRGIYNRFFNAGEYAELRIWHNKGSNRDTLIESGTITDNRPSLRLKWVSL